MWRNILAVILLPSLTAAQAAQSEPSAPPAPEQTTAIPSAKPRPKYQPFAFYDGIRRGTTEDVAVQLFPSGFVTTPKAPVAGIVPLQLDLQPAPGLSVTKLRYPKTRTRKFKTYPEGIPVAGYLRILMKVRADDNADLGRHVINGKLTFQPLQWNSTLGEVQQVDVEIPLTVVEHSAHVRKATWPVAHTPIGWMIVIIVLLPIEIPLVAIYYSVCALEGPGNCPD